MRVHLTDIAVRALKPTPGKQFKVWDTSTPGFGVLVGERAKSWIVMYGRERKLKVLGRFPETSLSAARTDAKRMLVDPPPASSQAKQFNVALREFIEYSSQRNRPSTTRDYERRIERHFPLGSTDLAEITPQDIVKRLDAIRDKPAEQRYALAAIRSFMAWCERKFYIKTNPCARLRPSMPPSRRDRVLSDKELSHVFSQADRTPYPFGAIVTLLILTGQRRREIAALRWEWIDEQTKTITLPSAITKNNRAHTFPYGDTAAAVLASVPRQNDYVFPAARDRTKGKPATVFNGWGKPKAAFDKLCPITPWTLHDLRRTFATNLAALGVRMEVTEKLLNHVSGSFGGIVGIYQRHSFQDEMREAISLWEDRLALLVSKFEESRRR
jgi:integrase